MNSPIDVLADVTSIKCPSFQSFALKDVLIDSRQVGPGSVFVALRTGERDGHLFVQKAVASGAKAVLVAEDWSELEAFRVNFPQVLILEAKDTLYALQDWASVYLRRFKKMRRIGITGSNGKTTTKEILGSILTQIGKTFISPGNYNSDIGLPLSVLMLREEPEFCVLEMGMNRPGEMAELAKVFFPDLGIITNIGTAHIGNIGSRDGIALEKKQIFSQMGKNSMALVPSDDPYCEFLTEGFSGRVEHFSLKQASNIQGLGGLEGAKFFWEGNEYWLPMPGEHNLLNALAAMNAARALGAEPARIKAGLNSVQKLFGRAQYISGEVNLYQDCYNANPDSVKALIKQIDGLKDPSSVVLVLGEMKELGGYSKDLHAQLQENLGALRVRAIYLFGASMQELYGLLLERGFSGSLGWTESFEELSTKVNNELKKGDLLVLKGSRGVALERLSENVQKKWVKESVN